MCKSTDFFCLYYTEPSHAVQERAKAPKVPGPKQYSGYNSSQQGAL